MDKEVFDIADGDYLDIGHMTVVVNGKLTTWVWDFAGPGHPATVDYNTRRNRDVLQQERLKEQAIVNGKKWKAPEETPDEVRERNLNWILSRLLGWSEVKLNGLPYPFTKDNAHALLSDPGKPYFGQAVEFLTEEQSFTRRSAASSAPSQSAHSPSAE